MSLNTVPTETLSDLGPFATRPEEWDLYRPLVGDSMIELGNKKNREHVYKDFFVSLGYRHVSVDMNGENGALPMDLTKPLNLGTFDMVTNIGTSEHVSEQAPCWKNMIDACHVGSVLVCLTPKPGQWVWHGEHYPHREFYEQLAERNGFEIERLYEAFEDPRVNNMCRMVRREIVPFVMPDASTLFYNVRRRYDWPAGQPVRTL